MKRPALVLVSAGLAMMWPADVPRAATSSVPGSAHQGAAVSDHTRANANTAVADLDERVARAMRTFEVPGLALAIVKDGRVVVAKGYGIRKLGEAAPVDARTLFGIASNTKAFTATALGMLVEQGKIQ